MIKESNEELKTKAKEWMQSEHGKRAIKKCLQKANTVTARLQKERCVNLKSLQEPFTI